jgi:hypothetical protein
LFPVGAQFDARVNVTGAGPINGFDITLSYNITTGPNPLQALTTGNELIGGLFDPNITPSGCSVLVAKSDIDIPPGRIRFAVVMAGGCSVNGTGTLFTITFQVTSIGATSIDIVPYTSLGKLASSIIGPSPNFPIIPFRSTNAYFRNKPGIPPVAIFTRVPLNPVANETVSFDASQSYDPDNSTLPGKGISRYSWNFGDSSRYPTSDLVNPDHIFTYLNQVPAVGSFTVHLVVWDVNNQLPSEMVQVVSVAPGLPILISQNWSGYAVSGQPGSVTDVKASWVVPGIVGGCPAFEAHAAMWVGIDGLLSSTVEQTGTDSACINGVATYSAWYEFFPRSSVTVQKMTVQPGDVMSAEVQYAGGNRFTISMSDVTTGVSFSRTGIVRGAMRSSAEWIAEAPSSKTGQLPLADFGTATFGQDYTGVAGTCTATVGQITGPLGSFGTNTIELFMQIGRFQLANPSVLSKDTTSFTVLWRNFT